MSSQSSRNQRDSTSPSSSPTLLHTGLAGDIVLKIKKSYFKNEGTSPVINKVNPEHMIYAAFPELANILEDAHSIMISMANIPDLFLNSVIVLIPKKVDLNQNITTDYRPVAIRSVHDKLVEYSFMT